MAEPRRRTFRVRNIPNHIKEQVAARFIRDILAYEGPTEDVHVYSLAPDVESYERPPTKERLHLSHDVIVDTHFPGFTVLNDVTTHEHISDCFAISGLASHPFGSWKARVDDGDFMWLRDILPMRYPGFRCIIYGYDTHLLDSHSFKGIEDLSRALTIALKLIGSGLPSSKPTIFMAHSLGGIVLKEALVQMARGNDTEMHLLSQTKKIVFFGVPNRGMHISHLISMVKGQPNEALVYRLSEQSNYLADLDERSSNLSYLRSTRVVSIYETRESQVPKEVEPRRWERTGSYAKLVSKESSIHCRSEEQDTYPVDKDHSNLVKFSEGDHDLNVILGYLNPDAPISAPKAFHVDGLLPVLGHETMGFVAQAPPHTVPNLCSNKLSEREEWKKLAKSLRQSLYSGPTFERYEGIEMAHADTFHWVFDNHTTNLSTWFVNSSSLYWINGKPGSGKSTMMKYVWTHKDKFRKNSHARNVDACFFFSHRGSYIQKSLEGLLHCILYQLCQNDALAHTLMPLQAALPEGEQLKWNADTLEDALFHVLQQQVGVANVFLLLDALDEFDGNPKRLALLLSRCVEEAKKGSINLKICFSCRPGNVFNDSFARTPQLRVEDHTEADIARYVRTEMTDCKAASSMLDPDDLAYRVGVKLQSKLLMRAQGVFLWVRLVLDKLLSELTEGASPEDIEMILETLPSAIEELYTALLERLRPRYRREGFIMLEIVLRAEHSVKLSQLRDATKCVLNGLEQVQGHRCSHPEDFRVDRDNMSRRLRSRCGGLLEVVQENYYDDDNARRRPPVPYYAVQLMHQTVKEFLLQPKIWRNFFQPDDCLIPLSGFSFLSQYYLTVLSQSAKFKPWSSTERRMTFLSFGMLYAAKAETLSGKSQSALLEAITDDSFSDFLKESERWSIFPRPVPVESRLSFAVLADMRLYMKEFIVRDNPSPHLLGQLLHCIVERQVGHEKSHFTTRGKLKKKSYWPGKELPGQPFGADMARLLLEAGADCTSKQNGMTPFESQFASGCYFSPDETLFLRCRSIFLNVLLFNYPGANSNADIEMQEPAMVYKPLHIASGRLNERAIEILLEAGADANGLDSYGRTPLDYIYLERFLTPYHIGDQRACVRLLTQRGAHLTLAREHANKEDTIRLFEDMRLLPVSHTPVHRNYAASILVRAGPKLQQIVNGLKGKDPRGRKDGSRSSSAMV